MADFCVDVAKAAYMHIHVRVVEELTNEQLDQLEAMESQEELAETVKKYFKEKTKYEKIYIYYEGIALKK